LAVRIDSSFTQAATPRSPTFWPAATPATPGAEQINIAKISKALLERLHEAARPRRRSEKAERANIPCLLRLHGERRSEDQSEDQRDRLARHPCFFFKMNP
jgi:hypothetical protein